MRERSYFIAGMFVMAGLSLIIFAIFTFSRELSVFNPGTSIYCSFNNIAGLKAGAHVFLSGYRVGSVSNIIFNDPGNIIVELDIRDQYLKFIPEDSVVSIVNTGLLGDKAVYIKAGNSDSIVQKGSGLLSRVPFDIDSAIEGLESFANILHKIEQGEGNLGILVNDDELYKTLLEGAKNFQEFSEKFNKKGIGVLLPW